MDYRKELRSLMGHITAVLPIGSDPGPWVEDIERVVEAIQERVDADPKFDWAVAKLLKGDVSGIVEWRNQRS